MTYEQAVALMAAYHDVVIGKPIGNFPPFSESNINRMEVWGNNESGYHVLLFADNPNVFKGYNRFLLTFLEENQIPIDRKTFGLEED